MISILSTFVQDKLPFSDNLPSYQADDINRQLAVKRQLNCVWRFLFNSSSPEMFLKSSKQLAA